MADILDAAKSTIVGSGQRLAAAEAAGLRQGDEAWDEAKAENVASRRAFESLTGHAYVDTSALAQQATAALIEESGAPSAPEAPTASASSHRPLPIGAAGRCVHVSPRNGGAELQAQIYDSADRRRGGGKSSRTNNGAN